MKPISKLLGSFASVAGALTLAGSLSTAPQAFAASGNWTANASSTWNTASNWSSNPIVPGTAAGDIIGLNFNITANRTVTINTAVTLGTLNIGDTDATSAYTLALSSGNLTLNNSGSGAVINMLATSAGDTISAPFTLADNLTINNSSAVNGFEARNLTISGNITESGGARSLTKTGTGAVILSGTNSYTGNTSVTGGALIFRNTASLPSTGNATFASGTTIGLGVGAAGFFSAANVDSAFGNTLANTSLNATTAIGIDTTSGNFSYTYGGGAANTRSLVKYGANTLTISGLSTTAANNYTGTTVIDQGTLAISGDASLTGGITFGATRGINQVGSLDLTNSSLTAGALTVQTDSTSNNTITIGAGKTLTTNGNVQIGTDSTGVSAGNALTKLTVAGTTSADGTWNVVSSNGAFRVGAAIDATRSGSSTLDMSGLANFSAELRTGGSGSAGGAFTVGTFNTSANGPGNTLILAGNSTISAAILNVTSPSASAATQVLLLGSGTQVINAGNINMSTGTRDSSSLSFNGGTGTIKIRGTAGGELDRANLTMFTGTTTNGTVASTFHVAGHAADLMLGTVKVLDSTGSFTSAFNYTATFSFDTGTLDATSFLIGSKSALNASSANTLAGIVNIGNGTTNATNSATMGTVKMASMTTTGTLSTGALTGTLNIAGGNTTVGITSLEVAKYSSANTTATATGAVNISGGNTTITNGITLGNRTTAGTLNGSLNLTGGNLSVGTAGVSGTNGIYTTGIGGATTTLTLNGGSLNLNGNAIGGAGQLITNLNFQSGTLSNVSQINNGAGLTKTTGGTLILSGNNTYTGNTVVSAGTLTLGSVTAMQNSVFDTTGAGTLSMGVITTPTLGGLSGGTNFNPTNYGLVTALTLNPQTGVTATYSGTLPDGAAAMTLSKTGLGTQVLAGLSGTAASNYTGLTTIDQGTLALSAASSNLTGGLTFGATATGGVNTGTLDLSSGSATFAGGLTVQTNSATANTISIGSGQTLTTGGTVVIGANGGTTGGYNPVSKLTVSGDSWTHTSSAGTFRVGNNSNAGASNQRAANSVLDLSGLAQFSADVRTTGLGTGGSFIVGDASNGANGSGELLTLSANNTISAGSITVQSGGAQGTNRLALGSGANVFNTATLTVGGGQREDDTLNFAVGTGTFTLRGGLGNGTANVNVGNLNSSSTGSRTSLIDFSGHSSDLAIGTLGISDTGTSLTSAVNHVATFTFDSGTMTATNVRVGGKQSNPGSSTATGTITANLNIGNGTTNLTNTSTLATTLVIANNLDDVGTIAGNLNIAGSATTVNFTSAANNLVIAQSDNGGNATGTVNISGGATTITRGITLANLTAGAGVVSGTINLTGGSLTLGTAGISTTAGTTSTLTLNGGSLNMNGNAIGGANAITNVNIQSGTLSNVSGINNGAGLTKTTGGTLILSGTNTYTGETLVSTGTLIVNGASSNSAFTVATGATLGGSGTVNGATTVQSGGTLSPGNSPGLASYANLTLDTGAIFKFELATNVSTGRGTNFDGVDILTGGSLAISTGVNSNLVFNAVGSDVDWNNAFWSANQSWLVFDLADGGYASNVPVVNSLSFDSLGQTLGSVHSSASFSYAISGGDVYLNYNAVPEPSTWALLAFSLTSVMVLRRRRNS